MLTSLSSRTEERFARLPVFSETDYFTLHPDVAQAGGRASEHALLHAWREGRAMFLESTIARAYGSATLDLAKTAKDNTARSQDFNKLTPTACITVFVSSMSSIGHKDLADSLRHDLLAAGCECKLRDESADYLKDYGLCIFIAPHEFFFMGLGQLWRSEQILAEAYVLNTETIASENGMKALPIILNARGILDISSASHWIWQSARLFSFHYEARIKLRETWLQPQDISHPLVLAMPPLARKQRCNPFNWKDRAVDVSFFGAFKPRRSAFFAQSADKFSQFLNFIYLQQGSSDHTSDPACERIIGHLSCQAKVTLHISADGLPDFDRLHMVNQILAGGSILVSDRQFLDRRCQAGVHYLFEDFKHLSRLVEWLIIDTDGQRKAEMVRGAAFDLIRDTNRDTSRPDDLLSFLFSAESEYAEI